jgi:hypothetical protein
MEDEAHVDERRRAAGLITLASYGCILRAMYGSQKNEVPPSPDASK